MCIMYVGANVLINNIHIQHIRTYMYTFIRIENDTKYERRIQRNNTHMHINVIYHLHTLFYVTLGI